MFLYNDFQGPEPEHTRDLSEELTRALIAQKRQRQVLGDGHGRGRAAERILEDTADERGALGLGPGRHVHIVDHDGPLGRPVDAGDDVEEGRLARAVAADERHKLAGRQREFDAAQRVDFVDFAGVKDLMQTGDA